MRAGGEGLGEAIADVSVVFGADSGEGSEWAGVCDAGGAAFDAAFGAVSGFAGDDGAAVFAGVGLFCELVFWVAVHLFAVRFVSGYCGGAGGGEGESSGGADVALGESVGLAALCWDYCAE